MVGGNGEFACVAVKELPPHLRVVAAEHAVKENPANAPLLDAATRTLLPQIALIAAPGHEDPVKAYLAGLTAKMWPASGVRLTVSFPPGVPAVQRSRILSHMNAWGTEAQANVEFRETADVGDVRIRDGAEGYWSYLGTDIRHVDRSQPTMNLAGFFAVGLQPEGEYHRVVRHETGHTLGFPHDQLLPEIVGLLDEQKTLAYFRATQGWSDDMIRANVLTPIDPSTLTPGSFADTQGVMCYKLPASITRNGQPIPGGTDINQKDAAYARRLYPRPGAPPPPPPPPPPPGGGDAAWIARVCKEQLDRAVTQGDTDWAMSVLKGLGGGAGARTALALFWGTAPEGRRAWIATLYRQLLGREPDQGGLDSFMGSGLDWPHVRAQMLGSDEYYNRAG